MKEERTEGIILRSFDYKENQRMITLLTQDFGLLHLIVKKISLKRPELVALTTPLSHGEYLYKRGRSDLYLFLDGALLDDHLALRAKFSFLQTAGEMVQALLHSQLPGKPAPALFYLALSYLKQIPSFERPEPLIASFLLKLLRHDGLFALDEPLLSFTKEEEHTLAELVSCKQFIKLKELKISGQLLSKIQNYYKGMTGK